MARLLASDGFRFETHCRDLPGRPDFAFRRFKVAVFVDGDFWHGWRFPAWKGKLAQFWRQKIETNRNRDRRSHARLRRMGWRVVRIWEHQLERNERACIKRVHAALASAGSRRAARISAGA